MKVKRQLTTAYFATPEYPYRRTKVHVCENGKPICGAKVKGTYHFCASGAVMIYVECEKCLKIWLKEVEKHSKEVTKHAPVNRLHKAVKDLIGFVDQYGVKTKHAEEIMCLIEACRAEVE
jgi:hypothetical protein